MKKLEITWKDPKTLIPYAKNAKVHSDEQINEVAGLISAFGFDQPIVVDSKGVIIKGHGRREASIRLNLKEVPVIVSTLDEYQAMASRIADNKVAEKSTWDLNLLKFDLGTLNLKEFDMKLTSIPDMDIKSILDEITADKVTPDYHRTTPKERKDDWEASNIRQIVLICDPETFDQMMAKIFDLMTVFGVDSNIDVVNKLIEFYENHSSQKN